MTAYKQLFRSRSNRMIGGVCAGLGEYMGFDPTIIRLAFVLISIFGHLPILGLVYLILLIVVPEQPVELPTPPEPPVEQ